MKKNNVYALACAPEIHAYAVATTSWHIATGKACPLLLTFSKKEQVEDQLKLFRVINTDGLEKVFSGEKYEITLDRENGTEVIVRAIYK